MSPQGHQPDQNQGTFLPHPRDLLTGAIKPPQEGLEALGAFPETTQPDLEKIELYKRLYAEKKALDSLAFENESDGHVQINQGKLNQQHNAYGLPPERESALVRGLKNAIKKSREAKEDSWLWSQRYFAQSIGVGVRLETRDKIGRDGKLIQRPGETYTVKEPVIVTVDPSVQANFDAAYEGFRAKYFGTDKFLVLDARRSEIMRELPLLGPARSGAPDPAFLARVQGILPPRP